MTEKADNVSPELQGILQEALMDEQLSLTKAMRKVFGGISLNMSQSGQLHVPSLAQALAAMLNASIDNRVTAVITQLAVDSILEELLPEQQDRIKSKMKVKIEKMLYNFQKIADKQEQMKKDQAAKKNTPPLLDALGKPVN